MLEMNAKSQPSPPGKRWAALLPHLPNALTLAAAFCGLLALRLSADTLFGYAMAAVGVAVIFDAADGWAARRFNAVTAFGAELDSLSDFLNFGVAPAIIVYQRDLYRLGAIGWGVAACYAAATMLRLARFNADLQGGSGREKARSFQGLPSTAAGPAALLAALASSFASPITGAIMLSAVLAVLSGLMVSKISVPSLQALVARRRRKH
jgi:CDP-diacylglycerol--serine O-phosphatidyltransferase